MAEAWGSATLSRRGLIVDVELEESREAAERAVDHLTAILDRVQAKQGGRPLGIRNVLVRIEVVERP